VPVAIHQQLQARAIQHSHANRVHGCVLAEILTTFQAAGIETLVLKGAALAHLVYPQPGLRPMRDMDLLVSQSQARLAQALLAELGFKALPPDDPLPAKHLLAAKRWVEGLQVTVELHHNLYANGSPATALEALHPAALPLTIAGMTAQTLSYEAMLDHIYQHLRTNLLLDSPRLIWLADLVSLAEHFAAEIDWPRVNPHARNALALCHWLTPLSKELLKTAALNPGRPPSGIGQEFQGWPRFSLAAQRPKGHTAILRDSFFPAEGWLRFYYGLPPAPSTKLRINPSTKLRIGPAFWWSRWVRHPLHILGWVRRYFVDWTKHNNHPKGRG